jgi:Kef-type K+ transport system membrane component KefB
VRSFLTYVLIIAVFSGAIWLVIDFGKGLPPAAGPMPPVHGRPSGDTPLRTLLLQVTVTLAAARAFSLVARKLGQPSVIGEIVAGIALGPTLLGHLAPAAFHGIFPPSSLGALKLLADIGVILFMFRVGLELDISAIRGRGHTAVVVSHASIVVPYLLGVVAAVFLFRSFAPAGTSFVAFALFTGIAMSITAFPVLAHILTERGMAATPLGTTALTCAAVDDITAWSLLAAVIAIVKAQGIGGVAVTVLLIAFFTLTMLRVVRPGLARLGTPAALSLIILFASAAITETIGVHSVFGAFLAGAILPLSREERGRYVDRLAIISPALLPLFFAYTGLRTELTLLADARSWTICLAIIGVATVGKLGGSAVAARITGMNWREALSLGALMNTRGLMELVALNIGYDLGILTPAMFAIMVVMALVTTMATGPLLALIERAMAEHVPSTWSAEPAE